MSIRRHTLYNLCGSTTPMLVGLVTVPLYLHVIGEVRYGVLALVWLVLGYFGLFDPGITRAATFHLSRLHQAGQERERESVFWTALAVNLAFGLLGAAILYAAARPLFATFFKVPGSMRKEAIASLPWLAASVPLSIITGVLGGALQARERFGFFNLISMLNAALTQIVPLAVAYWRGPSLEWLIAAVVVSRSIGTIPTCVALYYFLPLGTGGRFDARKLKTLFSYGGWVTITNLLNPLLTSMDRLLIGALLSAEAVALYTVPFNLVTRLSAIPGALQSSLFPRLSRGERNDTAQLASEAVTGLAAVMTPLVVATITVLPLFMTLWVGRKFALTAAPLAVILLVGVWINGLAYIPFGHLQAIERPDIVAKFHAFEFIPFVALLYVALLHFGLTGAAWVWTARVTIDAILLFIASGQTRGWRRILPWMGLVLLSAVLNTPVVLSAKMLGEIVLLICAMVWSRKVLMMVFKTGSMGSLEHVRFDAKPISAEP